MLGGPWTGGGQSTTGPYPPGASYAAMQQQQQYHHSVSLPTSASSSSSSSVAPSSTHSYAAHYPNANVNPAATGPGVGGGVTTTRPPTAPTTMMATSAVATGASTAATAAASGVAAASSGVNVGTGAGGGGGGGMGHPSGGGSGGGTSGGSGGGNGNGNGNDTTHNDLHAPLSEIAGFANEVLTRPFDTHTIHCAMFTQTSAIYMPPPTDGSLPYSMYRSVVGLPQPHSHTPGGTKGSMSTQLLLGLAGSAPLPSALYREPLIVQDTLARRVKRVADERRTVFTDKAVSCIADGTIDMVASLLHAMVARAKVRSEASLSSIPQANIKVSSRPGHVLAAITEQARATEQKALDDAKAAERARMEAEALRMGLPLGSGGSGEGSLGGVGGGSGGGMSSSAGLGGLGAMDDRDLAMEQKNRAMNSAWEDMVNDVMKDVGVDVPDSSNSSSSSSSTGAGAGAGAGAAGATTSTSTSTGTAAGIGVGVAPASSQSSQSTSSSSVSTQQQQQQQQAQQQQQQQQQPRSGSRKTEVTMADLVAVLREDPRFKRSAVLAKAEQMMTKKAQAASLLLPSS